MTAEKNNREYYEPPTVTSFHLKIAHNQVDLNN